MSKNYKVMQRLFSRLSRRNSKAATTATLENRPTKYLIPRRGGPLDGMPHPCCGIIYENLKEGQLFGGMYRERHKYEHALCIKEAIYRLHANSNGEWELIYVEPASLT